MHPEKSVRRIADQIARVNFMPSAREYLQPLQSACHHPPIECAIAFASSERRHAFDRGRPPDQQVRILRRKRLYVPRRRLEHKERNDRGGVPKLHRPSRRSSMRAATTDMPDLGRGGFSAMIDRASGARPARTVPSRAKRLRRPSWWSPPAIGSSRATGRPRSTIRIPAPPRRLSISALRRFLASVMLTIFMKLK
jgi:hypothetical protein